MSRCVWDAKELTIEQVKMIRNGYFPYIQGLHILLDYFIDQEEDVFGGDLNFCSYYENNEHLFERFRFFIVKAEEHTRKLPNEKFHQMIHRGLLGLYLSDNKLETQPETEILAKNC